MAGKDLLNQRFGSLVIVEKTPNKTKNRSRIWRCLCDCGKEHLASTSALTTGNCKSCGCMSFMNRKYIPKLGMHYGSLVYAGEAPRIIRPSKTLSAGYFVCKCGEEVIKGFQEVMQGTITSCGCMKGKKKVSDITGEKFGRLTAIESTGKRVSGGYIWRCQCDCGNFTEHPVGALNYGSAVSCGCLRVDENTVHGMSGTPTWRSWDSMIERCKNPKYAEWYSDVVVCEDWKLPCGQGFLNFYNDMGERPEGMTLNRVNGAKVYSKDTCEWATLSMQSFDQKRSKVNTSGRTGVYQVKETGRWVAEIKKNGVVTQVYRGDSFEEACKARTKAEIEYFGFSKE